MAHEEVPRRHRSDSRSEIHCNYRNASFTKHRKNCERFYICWDVMWQNPSGFLCDTKCDKSGERTSEPGQQGQSQAWFFWLWLLLFTRTAGTKSSSILLIAIVIVYLVTNTPRLLLNLAEYLRQVIFVISLISDIFNFKLCSFFWHSQFQIVQWEIKMTQILLRRRSLVVRGRHNGWCKSIFSWKELWFL